LIFNETKLPGAFAIDLVIKEDDRGFFARTWCRDEFERRGLNYSLVQCNTSYNRKKGTLRGLHYQSAPHQEAKLVRCTQGSIYDVVVDLRPDSATFAQWIAVELTSQNRRLLYVPEGCAHGFQTLQDHTEVFYQMSEFFAPESARGIRWNDPLFQIEWPFADRIISQRDQGYADYVDSNVVRQS
jgi:dTDP-4-dehydrorhamnose 3,5-epimerase